MAKKVLHLAKRLCGELFYIIKRPYELGFYYASQVIINEYLKRYFKFDVQGKENIPKRGVVFVLKHETCLDGPIMASILPRAHWWEQSEDPLNKGILSNKALGVASWGVGFIRVGLDNPRKSVEAKEKSKYYLKWWGDNIVIFPQGYFMYIKEGEEERKPYKVAATIARETGKPIVPVGMYVSVKDETLLPFLRNFEMGNGKTLLEKISGEEGTVQKIKEYVKKYGKIDYRVEIEKPIRSYKCGDGLYEVVTGDRKKPGEIKLVNAESGKQLDQIFIEYAMERCHNQKL